MSATPFNLCTLPPWAIASHRFNAHPQPLELTGVRQANRFLFARLAETPTPEARAQLFHDYLDVTFQLHQWQQAGSPAGRRSLRNSYLRFLRGWMFDSNSREGAVLKGWVESRFGLAPTYHRGTICDIHCDAYYRYLEERMRGAARTAAIHPQLDLLYEYVQDELRRRWPDLHHLLLYRGVQDFTEQRLLADLGDRRHLVRLNNLVSFTDEFERAWEFGSRVLEARVPVVKVVFMGGFLPSTLLRGEGEVLALGGEYEVRVLTGG